MDWIPGITSAGALAAALWFARSLISERLQGSVRHEFDSKLEGVKAEIREGERRLDAVRSTALAALASGQTALNERRLRAIEDLWDAATVLRSGAAMVSVLGALDLEEVAKHLMRKDAATQQLVRLVESFGAGFKDRLKDGKRGEAARLYVSPMAWVLYSAYSSIVLLAFLQMEALKAGGEPLQFIKTKETIEQVRTALPEYGDLLDKYGVTALREFLPDLEERLLAELRACAEGRDSDPEGAARARKLAELLGRQEAERTKREAGL